MNVARVAVLVAGAAVLVINAAGVIAIFPPLGRLLLIPLAMGSIAGLCLTFLGSKHLAFRPAKAAEAPSS